MKATNKASKERMISAKELMTTIAVATVLSSAALASLPEQFESAPVPCPGPETNPTTWRCEQVVGTPPDGCTNIHTDYACEDNLINCCWTKTVTYQCGTLAVQAMWRYQGNNKICPAVQYWEDGCISILH